jgi:hypothetical protein
MECATGSLVMPRHGAYLLAFGFVLAGCAGATASSVSPAASTAAASPSAEPSVAVTAIAGVWRGAHDCEGISDALAEAGFNEAVIIENIVGNGLVPGMTSPDGVADLTTLCEEATPLEHSHQFTADGRFSSYDQDGNEVDSGTYELVDDNTVAIGDPRVEFDFTIEGDHLTLEPQVEPGCLEFECQWAVMVAMPWSGMERVE